MKKSTSIRLFLLLAVVLCGCAYGVGYYYSVQQWEKRAAREPSLAGESLPQDELNPSDDQLSPVATVSYEYVLSEEDGYIIVYYADGETVYSNTDILVEYLPKELKEELKEGKLIYSEQELYNFLESHSS